MRIIPSENDGFVLVLFDFAFLDEPLFFRPDTLQQSLCRLVRWVLRYQLALDCFLQYRLFEVLWKDFLHGCGFIVYCSIAIHYRQDFRQFCQNAALFIERWNWCKVRFYSRCCKFLLLCSTVCLVFYNALYGWIGKIVVQVFQQDKLL